MIELIEKKDDKFGAFTGDTGEGWMRWELGSDSIFLDGYFDLTELREIVEWLEAHQPKEG